MFPSAFEACRTHCDSATGREAKSPTSQWMRRQHFFFFSSFYLKEKREDKMTPTSERRIPILLETSQITFISLDINITNFPFGRGDRIDATARRLYTSSLPDVPVHGRDSGEHREQAYSPHIPSRTWTCQSRYKTSRSPSLFRAKDE